jgi:hypothetical protein
MRYLLTLGLLIIATPVLAQGSIRQTTPATFPTPASIQDWEPEGIALDRFPGTIRVVLRATTQHDVKMYIEYPRDCGSFGASGDPPVPNPPACPQRDTSAEISALIDQLIGLNLTTRNLWRRVMDNVCADFPSRFPGGCVVQ